MNDLVETPDDTESVGPALQPGESAQDWLARTPLPAPSSSPMRQPGESVDDWMNRTAPGNDPALNYSLQAGLQKNPSTAARVLKMQVATGLPEDLIERNLPEVEEEAKKSTFDADWFRKYSPRLAGWLAKSPNHPAVAFDQLAQMGQLETLLSRPSYLWPLSSDYIKDAAAKSVDATLDQDWANEVEQGKMPVGDLGFPGPGTPFASKEEFRQARIDFEIQRRQAEEDYIGGPGSVGFGEAFSKAMADNPAKLIPFLSDVIPAADALQLYQAAKANEANSATPEQSDLLLRTARLEEASQLRGTSFGGHLANTIASLPAFAGELALTGGAYKLGSKALIETGKEAAAGLMRRVFAKVLGSAVQTVAARALPIATGALTKATPPGAVGVDDTGNLVYKTTGAGDGWWSIPEAYGDEFTNILSAEAVGLLSKTQPGITAQAVKENIFKGSAKEALKFLGMNETAGQMQQLGALVMSKIKGSKFTYQMPTIAKALTGDAGAISDVGAQLVAGAGLGAILTPIHNSEAQLRAEAFRRTGELTSQILPTVPEKKGELLEDLTKGGPNETVYVPEPAFSTYWQGQKDTTGKAVDPRTLATGPLGVDPQLFDQAKATQGDFPISRARWEELIGQTKHGRAFDSVLRTDPLQSSLQDVQDQVKAYTAEMEKQRASQEADKAAKETQQRAQNVLDSASRVHDAVLQQLQAIGMKPAQAKPNADIHAAFFRAMGSALGIDPEQLSQKYPLTVNQPESIRGEPGETLEQPGARGNIEWGPGKKFNINLLQNADKSTFLHETGHFYTEVLGDLVNHPNAPDWLKADYKTLLEFGGYGSAEGKAAMQKEAAEIQRVAKGRDLTPAEQSRLTELSEPHEKIARGFEQYLRTGEAPSTGLKAAFRRFKDWLTKLYKSVSDLGVQLSPEVRKVFDRMLATRDEISEAQNQQHRQQLFPDPWAAGMGDQKAQEYMKATADSELGAQEQLLKARMEEVKREESSWWKDQTSKVKEQITKEVNGRKEQVALAFLQKGQLPDGSPLPEEEAPFKLSRQDIENEYPGIKPSSLPRGVTDSTGKGIHPDLAAERLGFSSGEELLKTLQKLQESNRTPKERELAAKLKELETQRKALLESKQPLEAEKEEAVKNLKAGRQTLGKKLEAALRDEERASISPVQEILKDIKDRGGIEPSTPTQDLPKEFRTKKAGTGVGSDVLAQELYDRGHIDSADSEALYRKLAEWQEQLKASKERTAQAPKEASRLARERVSSSIEALIANTGEQENLKGELARIAQETRGLRSKVKPQKEALIDQLTQERMEELHGQPMSDDEIKAEAMKDIHNVDNGKRLRMEMEHLIQTNPEAFKAGIKEVTRRVPSEAQLRDMAVRAIGSTSVGKLDPRIHQAAEAKAAKQALDLYLKGDRNGAFDAKKREAIAHAFYRAALEAKEELESGVKDTAKFQDGDEKLGKSRDIDLVNVGRAVLSEFGLGSSDKSPEDYLESIRKYDADGDTYGALKTLVDQVTQGAAPYREISVDHFREMKKVIDALWDLSRRTKQMEISGKLVDRDDVIQAVGDRIRTVGQDYAGRGRAKAMDWKDDTKSFLLSAEATLRRAESWADMMDGDDPTKPLKTNLTNPIFEATSNFREAKRLLLKSYLDNVVKLLDPESKKLRNIAAPELGYTFANKGELLSALLHIGNWSNFQKLLRGRGWGSFDKDGNLDTSKWDSFIDRMHQEGVLTKADYDFVQGVWDLFEGIKPEAQKAHKDMYGYHFNEVTSRPVDTPFGTYRGGYVPAMVDPRMAFDAAVREGKQAVEQSNSYMFPTTGRGFTKARIEQYAGPMLLSLDALPAQFDKILRFIHIEPHVKDVARVILNRGFAETLDSHNPEVSKDLLMPWLLRAAQQKIEQPALGSAGKYLDKFYRYMRSSTTMQTTVGNLSAILQYLPGISVAATKVEVGHLRDALWDYVTHPKQTAQTITDKSVYMRNRVTGQLSEIRGNINDILTDPSVYQTARNFMDKHGYVLNDLIQNALDNVTWQGAYNEAIEKGLEEKEAVLHADSMVRQTQWSNAPEDVSRAEAGTAFQRLFTMGMSYPNMLGNLLRTEGGKAKQLGGWKGARRGLYVALMAFTVPALLQEGISRAMSGRSQRDLDDADNNGYLTGFMKYFFGSQIKSATGMVPIAGPIANAVWDKFTGQGSPDSVFTTPAARIVKTGLNVAGHVQSALSDTGKPVKPGAAIRDAFSLIGDVTHIPLNAIARPLGYLADVEHGDTEPTSPVDFTRGLISGSGVPKR